MVIGRRTGLHLFFLLSVSCWVSVALAQSVGSIRGMIHDKDFEAPLPKANVSIAETGQQAQASDEGNYVLQGVQPGKVTLVFAKEGYARLVKADVVVSPGRMTELNVWLSGDFTEMAEFIVQDIQIGGATEAALLDLRMDSPALQDSISADLMSQAGAGDAASALRLVAGATVQDGKYAVVRGLPDRYVNSQMNGVRLPTADTDKRAVQLDQFPSAAIESVRVTKTFTPDQQGDASGGAVNIVLKGIPEENVFKYSSQISFNTQAAGRDDFLTYKDGGVGRWGKSGFNFWEDNQEGLLYDGTYGEAVGVSTKEAPTDYKWSMSAGGKYEFDSGITIGGLANFYYERDSSFTEDGINDKYWVEEPGAGMTPQYGQGTPRQGDFKTKLFDVKQGKEEVKWGALGTVGVETENHKLSLTYLYTRVAENAATLAEDTRGKAYYFPGYDPYDPDDPGNQERSAAPYLRTETLQYTERITQTLQAHGQHTLPFPKAKIGDVFEFLNPELDWTVARSSSELHQPDKRQFGSLWWASNGTVPAFYLPYKPAANFTLGNLQRIWKDITETSDQYQVNIKFPFRQWTDAEGYVKFGVFNDQVLREYNQDSFSNFNDNSARYTADWSDFWSEVFPFENHPLTAAEIDVDYIGEQTIKAWYYMVDLPLVSGVPLISALHVIGGMRYEDTQLSIVNTPEGDVTWVPPGAVGSVQLNPGDADVFYEQSDALPSLGFIYSPTEKVKIRGTYSETVARQTFKELTPIQQQEFLGGDVFIGNPSLRMSALKNYDLRVDYAPYTGGLVSASYFRKDITDPIEYVQRIADFPYTTAINYPEGELSGFEMEVRQDIGRFHDWFEGLSIGANATLIESEVTLPDDEAATFEEDNIQAPMKSRDMTNAPEHLYNCFVTYDMDKIGFAGTRLGLFYTVRGDTLIAGAGQSKGNFIPNVYETEHATLNLSLTKKFGDFCSLKFQAKNLTNPAIETVYRSEYIDEDVKKTSYKKGMEFSFGLSGSF